MAGLFPAIDDIPATIRLAELLFLRHILIDGKLREWNGPTHMVIYAGKNRNQGIRVKDERLNNLGW
jgi:hypothetical protein